MKIFQLSAIFFFSSLGYAQQAPSTLGARCEFWDKQRKETKDASFESATSVHRKYAQSAAPEVKKAASGSLAVFQNIYKQVADKMQHACAEKNSLEAASEAAAYATQKGIASDTDQCQARQLAYTQADHVFKEVQAHREKIRNYYVEVKILLAKQSAQASGAVRGIKDSQAKTGMDFSKFDIANEMIDEQNQFFQKLGATGKEKSYFAPDIEALSAYVDEKKLVQNSLLDQANKLKEGFKPESGCSAPSP